MCPHTAIYVSSYYYLPPTSAAALAASAAGPLQQSLAAEEEEAAAAAAEEVGLSPCGGTVEFRLVYLSRLRWCSSAEHAYVV
jgi:hypothetical protein